MYYCLQLQFVSFSPARSLRTALWAELAAVTSAVTAIEYPRNARSRLLSLEAGRLKLKPMVAVAAAAATWI